MNAIFLKAVPVTQANLDVPIKAGHISQRSVCKGVAPAARTGPPASKPALRRTPLVAALAPRRPFNSQEPRT